MSKVLLNLMRQMSSCGRYSPVMPAKYRIRKGQRQRQYRCQGCAQLKWFDVEKRTKESTP